MTIVQLPVTGSTRGNTRCADGVHIALIDDQERELLGLCARWRSLASGTRSTTRRDLRVESAPPRAARRACCNQGRARRGGPFVMMHCAKVIGHLNTTHSVESWSGLGESRIEGVSFGCR